MDSWTVFGIRIITGDTNAPPRSDNDNWTVASSWETPAEALQKLRRMKGEMRRELAADFTLRACPKHRRIWESLLAAEKCALWHYYGVRQG
jgi:hypothetical protein